MALPTWTSKTLQFNFPWSYICCLNLLDFQVRNLDLTNLCWDNGPHKWIQIQRYREGRNSRLYTWKNDKRLLSTEENVHRCRKAMMTPGLVDYNRIVIKHRQRGQLFDHINIVMVGGHNSSEGGQPTSLQSDLVLACALIQHKNGGI